MPKLTLVLLLSLLVVCSCETKQEKIERLQNQLKKLELKKARLLREQQDLQQKKKKVWHSSAKERFAELYEIHTFSGHRLEDEDYIRKVRVRKKSQKEYHVSAVLQPTKTIKPEFRISLFNRKGLLVGDYFHKRPFFSKIHKGEIVEKSEEVEVSESPYYFRVSVFH